MSKTLSRGLALIEVIDLYGPLTVAEIADHTGVELTAVYRAVAVCERDGWLVRENGKVVIGTRSALLGMHSKAARAVQIAGPLVQALGAATGVNVSASALAGPQVMSLAQSSGNPSAPALPEGFHSGAPLHLLADARAIAAQLPADQLTRLLPAEPYPTPEDLVTSVQLGDPFREFLVTHSREANPLTDQPRDRASLDAVLESIRATGFSYDNGQFHPSIRCIARPWPSAGIPAVIACVGPRDEMTEKRTLIEACLVAAAQPGGSPGDVIRAAAPFA